MKEVFQHEKAYPCVFADGRSLCHGFTLPGIRTQVILLLILAMGGILGADFEKVLNLYVPLTYEVADVISTYTYRVGLQNGSYSYGTAIGLFNTLVNVTFVLTANTIGKKVADVGLF